MQRRVLTAAVFLFSLLSLQPPFTRETRAQASATASGDFDVVNFGDFITLQRDPTDSAAWYFVYLAFSSEGPWSLLFSIDFTTGGAKVHGTPDARIKTLCYKVEAKDTAGAVIKIYGPICVPKYAGKQ